ncbi:hypothetical protein ACP70R_003545 [Stipagrostis hirtigluma subsp. patula]
MRSTHTCRHGKSESNLPPSELTKPNPVDQRKTKRSRLLARREEREKARKDSRREREEGDELKKGREFGHIRKASVSPPADLDSFRRIYPNRIHHHPPLPPFGLSPASINPASGRPVSCHRGAPSLSLFLSLHLPFLQFLSSAQCTAVRRAVDPPPLRPGAGTAVLGVLRVSMQDQLICNGCKRVLQYRRGDAGVCCPVCNTFTSVNTSGSVMSEMVCSRCPTLLVYNRGVANIRCPHCNTVNSTRSGANQVCHLSCGQCRMILAYQLGASTVGCPGCRYVNHVRDARPQTVLVENPKTLDERGKLVSNMAVGVTSRKR